MTRYNHAYDFAFSVLSDHPTGDDVTSQQLFDACSARLRVCLEEGSLLEACDMPFDTYEEEEVTKYLKEEKTNDKT